MPPLDRKQPPRHLPSVTSSRSKATTASSPEEVETPLKRILSKLRDYAFREFAQSGSDYEAVLSSIHSRVKNLPAGQRRRIVSSFGLLMKYAGVELPPSTTSLARLATAFGYWDFLVDRYPDEGPMELGPIYLASMPGSARERSRIRKRVLRKSGLPPNISKLGFVVS